MGIKVCIEARKQGLLIRPLGHIIVIMPPLIIKIDELDSVLEIIYKSIQMVIEEISNESMKDRKNGA